MEQDLRDLTSNSNYTELLEFIEKNGIVLEHGEAYQQIKEIWLKLFNESLSTVQSKWKINYLREKGHRIIFRNNYYEILIEYIIDNKIIFKYGKTSQQFKLLWLKLFNENLSTSKCNTKIGYLKRNEINCFSKKNNYEIFIKYVVENKILFQKNSMFQETQEIWLKLFNEKISSEESNIKIQYLKRKEIDCFPNNNNNNNNNEIFNKYIIENKVAFQKNERYQEIQEIWFELFNETISTKQSIYKIRKLKEKGYDFIFKKDSYVILSEYLINNKIVLQKGKASIQIKEIWFKIFNEILTSEQCSTKIKTLKRREFNLNIKKDYSLELDGYLINNKMMFQNHNTCQQIQKNCLEHLKINKSFQNEVKSQEIEEKSPNFKDNSYNILIKHMIDNKITLHHGNACNKLTEIWFELFGKKLSLGQCTHKIIHLRKKGINYIFEKDSFEIVINYLIDNKIVFNQGKICRQIKEIWFKIFNVTLSDKQSGCKIETLKDRGFKFILKKDFSPILTEYLLKNKIVFQQEEKYKQMQKIWFKLFNQDISYEQSKNKINLLKRKGFQFVYEKSTSTLLELEEYILKNKIVFRKSTINQQIREIWFEIFSEILCATKSSSKIINLKKKGFVFTFKKDYYEELEEYLSINKIVFQNNNSWQQIQKIWFKLFNETLSSSQSNSRVIHLKKRGFVFIFEKDSYTILIEHLKTSNLWIEESKEGYIYLQKIWGKLFKEEINFKKCHYIIIKTSLLYPQYVNRKIISNFVSYNDLNKLSSEKYEEYVNSFAIFCKQKNIILSHDINEEKLSRIWSVCFATKR